MESILESHALPWYVIDADERVIRVYHGDLDKSWWKRGMSDGEGKVRKVEDIIREATGLQRVTRIHDRDVVEFRIRKELFNRAAVALKLSIKCVAESDDLARMMVERKRKPE
jgi:hypothetical protein